MPEFNKDHCEKCGEKTITECPSCKVPIRGYYWSGGLSTRARAYEPPPYCQGCGSAFPWTQRSIQAAHELVVEVGGLAGEEAAEFDQSIQDIVRDTPRTPVAAHRMKKLLQKLGLETASGVKGVLVNIASETARRILWPNE